MCYHQVNTCLRFTTTAYCKSANCNHNSHFSNLCVPVFGDSRQDGGKRHNVIKSGSTNRRAPHSRKWEIFCTGEVATPVCLRENKTDNKYIRRGRPANGNWQSVSWFRRLSVSLVLSYHGSSSCLLVSSLNF
ncbi:unnamed protein product [Macrosiphum euphorbiae]|uniref:Uncharacterized protein n=1 Tax=Macrosiphum euphorbiae TaxID=13131 RepID=A0AAV0XIR9_9HEMI|nr:unnamed protein product [Macrosiphum euphorbiae]